PVLPSEWHPVGLRVCKLPGWPAALPQPYLTNVGLDKLRSIEWFIDGAAQFIEIAARDLAARNVTPAGRRPRHLLALPVVGTGYGGGGGVAGDIVRLLVPALESGAQRHGVDVVLVAYEEQAFAAAQAYRRSSLDAWPELPLPLRRTADQLAA